MTVVRQARATRKQEREGLAERKPNCGCSVEIDPIHRIRQELEAPAAELAIEQGGGHREMRNAYQQMKAAARSGDPDASGRRDLAFHQALWGGLASRQDE
jgi:DNA-binding GntR family transcriptional regulator